MLQNMIDEYREGNPEDHRDDRELVTDLMEHFVESGVVKKKGEKFILPKIRYDA